MQLARLFLKAEILDKMSIGQHGLGPNPGPARDQVVFLDFRHQFLDGPREFRLRQGPVYLVGAHGGIPGQKPPKARIKERAGQIGRVDASPAITLPGESEDSIGTRFNAAAHEARKMHPQKGESWVWNRVDKVTNQMLAVCPELVEFTTEWNHPGGRLAT